ncbi:TBCC domain-containing protein 1 [Rhinophrynus dorsalis]
MDSCKAQLWVKTDSILVGALQSPPPAKFSIHYLRKLATYVRTRSGDGCYPRLYWFMWRHIACGKLQIVEEIAWLYFEVFHSIAERSASNSLEWAEAASSCSSVEEYEKLKNQLSVDTLKFLLFLYIQQINKVSLRTSLIGEEWPSPKARSPDFGGQSSFHNKNWDDYSHHDFLKNNISYLLELLLEPDQLNNTSNTRNNSLVSIEAVQALGFLIEGTVDKSRTVHPILDLALWQPLQSKSGFSKTTSTFSLYKLEAWIKESLVVNPFGMSACIRSGKKMAWAHQVDGSNKRAKVACNMYKVPHGHRMVVMSQIYRQTLAKSSETLDDARVRIHQCNESYIYLLSPLRSVTVEKCRNSTIILGPVQTALHVNLCDNVKVIAVCHRLSLSSTTNCTFHILTPTQPLLLSGNQNVVLGPFHTHYPMLEDHMGQTGLATLPNYWDRPLLLPPEISEQHIWKLMSPQEFYTFVVPFQIEGDTREIPGGLPPAYLKSICQRQHKVQMWQKTVKDAVLTREQRSLFQALVEHKFNEWLINTENRHQLDSLVPNSDISKQAALYSSQT